MKTLAVFLSILLILPLAAQEAVTAPAKPPYHPIGASAIIPPDEASGSGVLKPAPPLTTLLAAAEHDQLALALMQAQAARLNLLEALAGKRAGTDDITASEEATRVYSALLQSLAKQHAACSGAQWNFGNKSWMCPPEQSKQ